MMIGVGLEFALGVASLLLVPIGRPDEWLPLQGRAISLVHAVLGGMLMIGALTTFVVASGGGRIVRLGAQIGLVRTIAGRMRRPAGFMSPLAACRYGTDVSAAPSSLCSDISYPSLTRCRGREWSSGRTPRAN